MVRDSRNSNILGEGRLRRAADGIGRRGGEWNLDTKGRYGFQVEGIVVSVMGCCLSQSIRTYMAVGFRILEILGGLDESSFGGILGSSWIAVSR